MIENELERLVEGLPKALGLNGFKIAVQANSMTTDISYIIETDTKKLRRSDFRNGSPLDFLAQSLEDTFAKTVWFLKKTEVYDKEISDLKGKNELLEDKIKELQVFKTHYDIQMKLNHGENLTIEEM